MVLLSNEGAARVEIEGVNLKWLSVRCKVEDVACSEGRGGAA